ncbi:MAG: hypothetical protein JXB32_21445 [Deltaproteobacteria bacterium]|nr:hypothetical protein [Deltaproteobacteria bacterium]
MTRRKRWMVVVLPALLAALPACRKGESLPAVPGAKHVVPFSAVRLFRETPVSTREFDDEARRWTKPSSPRFDEGILRSRLHPDGTREFVEFPPKMAFRNRGDDCGPSSDRRICPLAWESVDLKLCGRPFVGQLDLPDDDLGHASVMVCRLLAYAHPEEDGAWVGTARDCTSAQKLPLSSLHPQDFSFRVGDTALVPDAGASYDRKVCERLVDLLAEPPPPPPAPPAPVSAAAPDAAAAEPPAPVSAAAPDAAAAEPPAPVSAAAPDATAAEPALPAAAQDGGA